MNILCRSPSALIHKSTTVTLWIEPQIRTKLLVHFVAERESTFNADDGSLISFSRDLLENIVTPRFLVSEFPRVHTDIGVKKVWLRWK